MAKTKANPFEYEDKFALLLAEHNFPKPHRQFHFVMGRDWAFDFAWPEMMIAVEVNGGQWLPKGGRHNRDSDRIKMNRAQALGWTVLVITPEMMKHKTMWPGFLDDLRTCFNDEL